ncbi:hypothetical protein MSM1_02550 [Mycobacterium sp. SM1]|uniref:hypothetical protein n=1 Tax=Mycobacterium sp. SM1 TaxID=2816243 RepID=UPI001BCD112D|nr:hypothetical protein [Mycobacterium sp. SM1]MBS4727287.1 hypothetical protein [Mycobacterium sp. SM1]
MPRRRRLPRRQQPIWLLPVTRRAETGPDGHDYEVRPVAGARAVKNYRCPGCDHEIRSGTAHVVVWPVDSPFAGVDDRRHWHTMCWAARTRRRPTRVWL